MGRVNKKSAGGELPRLPSGAFTVDAQGQVISSTVPQAVPGALVEEIGQCVMAAFQGARKDNLSFSEMVAQYAAFMITAREMRGGAIIFLSPKTPRRIGTT
jgi:hypothetical protein